MIIGSHIKESSKYRYIIFLFLLHSLIYLCNLTQPGTATSCGLRGASIFTDTYSGTQPTDAVGSFLFGVPALTKKGSNI